MKKLTIFTLAYLFIAVPAIAQWQAKTGVTNGYKWNIFKSPDVLVETSETLSRNQLWQNSVFNGFFIDTDYHKKWENSRLKISADLGLNLYYQQSQAHKNEYRLYASYRANYADNRYIEFAPEFKRKQQDGVNQNDLIYSTRLSYRQFEAPVHLDFYLGDRAWLKFEAKYRLKIYDQFDNNETRYSAYYLEALYKKKWKNPVVTHEISAETELQYRDQNNIAFTAQNSPIIAASRAFSKVEAGTAYKLKTSNSRFEIEFPVTATLVGDYPSGNLNYNEIEFGTDVQFYIAETRIKLGAERTLRNFSNFKTQSGRSLNHQFWDFSFGLKAPLTTRLALTTKASFVTRNSNRERTNTFAYREYTTSYFQTGIEVKF